MDFLKKNANALKKKTMQWIYPNENPTDIDKYAFNLLEKAEVDFFIEFMEKNTVNVNVVDYSKTTLLIKAQGIPSYKNPHTKLLSKGELQDRAIKAILYLVKRGVNINQRTKNGSTALLCACHWGYSSIVKVLLESGANPNLGSEIQGFQTNPLLSAAYKGHTQIITLLLLFRAHPCFTEQINKTTQGWRLSQEDLSKLYSQFNIIQLTSRRRIEMQGEGNSILIQLSQRIFDEMLMNA